MGLGEGTDTVLKPNHAAYSRQLLTLVCEDISQVSGTTVRVRVNGTVKVRLARVIRRLVVGRDVVVSRVRVGRRHFD